MTPQEKAERLVDKYVEMEYLKDFQGMYFSLAKQCALIAVDEILKEVVLTTMYWQEVKQEIEKL